MAAYWSGRGAYDGGRLWPATLDAASSITSGVVTFRITVPVLGSAVLSFLVYGGLAADPRDTPPVVSVEGSRECMPGAGTAPPSGWVGCTMGRGPESKEGMDAIRECSDGMPDVTPGPEVVVTVTG